MEDSNTVKGDGRGAARGAQSPGAAGSTPGAPEIARWLAERLAARLGVDAGAIDPRRPLSTYGLASRDAVSLAGEMEERFGVPVSATVVYERPTIEALAALLARQAAAAGEVREPAAAARPAGEPIAVIGVACRLPGAADARQLWRLLAEGTDAVGEVPAGRFDIDRYFDASGTRPGTTTSRWGGFISDIEGFDPSFFQLAPHEALRMDPQQRLLLETAWEALEDGGQAPSRLAGSRTGVFVGVSSAEYVRRQIADPALVDGYTATGNALSVAANRISYFLDLVGPSLAVDTACSSSLTSVWLACESLRRGESTLALAGGANLVLTPWLAINFSRAGLLAGDGRCKVFDARADGTVRSDGVGVVVLKPLSRALADGDPIYCTILGGAVNHDGRTNGLVSPSPASQKALLRAAYADAAVDPREVGYVEAHGTGTALGDAIEAEALGEVLGAGRSPGSPCRVGSIKSNIGHAEAAAGIAGLIKLALALRRGQLPPSLHYREDNPHVSLARLGLEVQAELGPWPERGARRLAGLSSFGFGGSNAHLVLEGPPASTAAPAAEGRAADPAAEAARPLFLSAHDRRALTALARAWIERLDPASGPLHDLCAAAARRRSHHELRLAVVGRSGPEMARQLEAFVEAPDASGLVVRSRLRSRPRLAFVFSGQGGQWAGMGRQLLEEEPVFRSALEACDRAVRAHAGWSVVEVLRGERPDALEAIDVLQPTLFALQVALATLWRSWRIEPEAVVGHSMGEVAAAQVAGGLSLDDAARVICTRSRLLRGLGGAGGMALVGLPAAETARAIEETTRSSRRADLAIAAINGPRSTVVAGSREAVQALLAAVEAQGAFVRAISVDTAGHTEHVEPVLPELGRALAGLRPRRPSIPFYSAVGGGLLDRELDAAYWAANLRQPVQFGPCVERMARADHLVFLEIGPHPLLCTPIEQAFEHLAVEGAAVGSLRRGMPERHQLLTSAGALYQLGLLEDFSGLFPSSAPAVDLPSYPWQRTRLWLEEPQPAGDGDGTARRPAGPAAAWPGERVALGPLAGHHLWEIDIQRDLAPVLAGRPAAEGGAVPPELLIELALAGLQEAYGEPLALSDIRLRRSAPVALGGGSLLQTAIQPAAEGAARVVVCGRRPGPHDGAGWAAHLEASVPPPLASAPAGPLRPTPPALPELRGRLEPLEAGAVDLGVPGLRLAGARCRDGEVLAQIAWAEGPDTGLVGTGRCSALIEAGRRLLVAAAGADGDARGTDGQRPATTTLGIERLRIERPAAVPRWIHGRVSRSDGSGTAGAFRVLDEAGETVLEADGVHAQPCAVGEPVSDGGRTGEPRGYEQHLWEVAWLPVDAPRASHPRQPGAENRWLLMADRAGVADALAGLLRARGERCILARAGDAYRRAGADEHVVRPACGEDLDRLVEALTDTEAATWRGVVHLWSLDGPGNAALDGASLDAARRLGSETALLLVQRLGADARRQAPRLWLVTAGAQAAGPSETAAVSQAALWGLGRVIETERPELLGGLVDLPAAEPEQAAAQLWEEIAREDGLTQVALRGSERRVPRLVPRARPEAPAPVRWRPGAAYLLSGGLGGIALEVAEWMVSQGARELILVGRTPLPPRDAWDAVREEAAAAGGRPETAQRIEAVRRLEAMGARIQLAAFDAADAAALARLLAQRAEGGRAPIRGVFHLAGVLADAPLQEMDPASMAAVMRPKVDAAWNLHALLPADLDFFVLFSSAASLLGTPGQANYAAANAALDALAELRWSRGLPALTLNWGPWAEVGLAARPDRGGRLVRIGIGSVSPALGIGILADLLRQRRGQVAVIPVDRARLRQVFAPGTEPSLLRDALRRLDQEADAAARPAAPALTREALQAADPPARRELLDRYLRSQIARLLGVASRAIDPQAPLTTLGFDSLMAVGLKTRMAAELGVSIDLRQLLGGRGLGHAVEHAVARSLAGGGGAAGGAGQDAALPRAQHDAAARFAPFPLTDMQQAYWIGRTGSYELGVAGHVYVEIDCPDLDLERLTEAWNRLLARHDMLRARMLPDGRQEVLPEVPRYEIEEADLRGWPREQARRHLEELRRRMSHQQIDVHQWPLFEYRATRLDDRVTRLHLSIDFLLGDAWSLQILCSEWLQLYKNPRVPVAPLELTFRDYVMASQQVRRTESYRRSLEYWRQRVRTLPPAPELPLAASPQGRADLRFRRRPLRLSPERWERLRGQAARRGLTPFAALCAAYAEVVARWSRSPRFTLNLPGFNRLQLHPQVNEIVGTFTSFTLLEVDASAPAPLEQRAQALQAQLFMDLEHAFVSGVEVLRELARVRGSSAQAAMPVVLTSTIGLVGPSDAPLLELGEIAFEIAQTPQVWLDTSVSEDGEKGLVITWDTVEELFPAGMMDSMFDAFRGLLLRLADDEAAWSQPALELLPEAERERIARFNATAEPLPEPLLQDLIEEQALRRPRHPALVAGGRTLDYDELWRRSDRLAAALQQRGARPDTVVAVVMEKGWEQVVGLLAVVKSGAAYLPVDPELPAQRRRFLLEHAEARLALTHARWSAEPGWPDGVERLVWTDELTEPAEGGVRPQRLQRPDSLAYVIFTSGTTGRPKGVMVEHRGVVQAVLYTNRRFGVGPSDRAIALAKFDHDLSVYDLFGTLAAGATLVVPDADGAEDPRRWAELVREHRVTVWNTVPVMMQMLLEAIGGDPLLAPRSLRLVFLGGDWIPLALPDRIRAAAGEVTIVSVGGPTETTLWNIMHEVGPVDPGWRSVPYGRPIANSRYHVLNERLEPCPAWVPGRLFCAGACLSRGYWRDEEQTAKAFIRHPASGERLYDTGDLGRLLPDGTIEFLGRADFQVKVMGHRIETLEIEAVLRSHPAVAESVVVAVGDGPRERYLHAFVTPAAGAGTSAAGEELRSHLSERLPRYMVPRHITTLPRLPLTANNKVDRAALARIEADAAEASRSWEPPRDPVERRLAETLTALLQIDGIGVFEDVFLAGANSLHATQLLSRVRADFTADLPYRLLFQSPTVAGIAEAVALRLAEAEGRELVDRVVALVEALPDDEVERRLEAEARFDAAAPAAAD